MPIKELHELIERYLPLAKSEARKMSKRTPLCVTYDELESAAYEGLCLAANKCDNEASFGAYARFRIRGCMLDYLRSLRWTSRENVRISFMGAITEDSNAGELAQDAQRNTDEFFRITTESLNALGQQIVLLYYVGHYSMKEIGEIVGVCESRISQILSEQKRILSKQWDRNDLWSILAV